MVAEALKLIHPVFKIYRPQKISNSREKTGRKPGGRAATGLAPEDTPPVPFLPHGAGWVGQNRKSGS